MKITVFNLFTLTVFILLSTVSCTTYKTVPYFADIPDTTKPFDIHTEAYTSPVIQPDDILSITVVTLDPEANVLFNKSSVPSLAVGSSTATPIGQQLLTGYLVDKDGFVDLPQVGKISLAGYTTSQARDTITNRVTQFYTHPSVDVRYANFRITVLGEVNRPATYTVPNEKITLFDALGLAGDLTIFGKRENILLIRETGEQTKHIVRLNLNSKNIMNSPYFFLKQNDVLYVEPNKAKSASLDAVKSRNYVLIGTALSVLLVIATRIK